MRGAILASGVSFLALSASLAGGSAFAGGAATPSGGQFAAGAGSITATSNGLAITQSTAQGIINWQNFSIGQGNAVSIANGAGATLNRVTGGNISSIAGSLTSTGSVYLINPAGVIVMPTGQVVTTGSFVASTRDISDSSFLAGGVQEFKGTSSGTVVNQGSITSSNGNVVLIGQSVVNSGQISAPNGTVGLAAGDDVLLQPSGSDQTIQVNAGTGDVTNSGTIAAAQAELDAVGGNVYALATNNGGIIRATGSTTRNGHVYLTAGNNITVDGTVSATNADGSGGAITATAGAASGTLSVTGAVNASATSASAKGGTVTLTANTVNVGSTAAISADGGTSGGNIFIGGDRHGGTDPSVALSPAPIANAQYTTVAAGARISANGGASIAGTLGASGNGGNVIVWSDVSTSFAGSISAQGGASGGNGGFVEVSGEHLNFTGAVNTLAPSGATGTLLLDPSDVLIYSSTDSNAGSYTPTLGSPFTPTSGTSYILNTDVQNALGSSNVTITTGSLSDGLSGTGNISLGESGPSNNRASISWSSSSSLTLSALGIITTAGDITTTGSGAITLTAAGNGQTAGSAVTAISLNGNISANGGTISLLSTGATFRVEIGQNESVTNTNTNGAGTIILQGDQVRVGSSNSAGPSGIVSTPGEVDILPATNGPVFLGDNAPDGYPGGTGADLNSVLLRTEDLPNITANLLVIGSAQATSLKVESLNPTGEIANSGWSVFDAANVTNLKLVSSGAVSQDANVPIIVNDPGFTYANTGNAGTGGLAVSAGGAITLAHAGNSFGTVALSATGNIALQGNTTTDSTGTLSIATVAGVSGITTTGSGATTTLINAGTVTQDLASANNITSPNLVLEGGGSFTLNNLSNAVSNIAASVSALSFTDNQSLTVASLSDDLTSPTTFNGVTGTGAITVVDNGLLTIASGAPLATSGGDVLLEDQTFTNSDGTAAFSVTGAGKYWRVYSQDPRNDSDGALTSANYSFVQYAAANSYGAPSAATTFTNANAVLTAAGNYGSGTGNGFLYSVSPTVTESVSNAFTKVYDGTKTYAGAGGSSETLAYNAAVIKIGSTVVTNLGAGGTADTVNLTKTAAMTLAQTNFYSSPNVGTYTLSTLPGVTVSFSSATDKNNVAVYGYSVSPSVSGSASITAKPITITGSRTYDQSTTAAAATFASLASQLVASDIGNVTLSGSGITGSANAASYSTTNGNASVINGLTLNTLALSGTASGNYSITVANYTINPAALLISANPQTKVYGATDPTLTYTESGLLSGDSDTLSGALTRVAGETVLGGPYAINQGTLASTNSNYTISYTGNNLTITAKPITITGVRDYDQTTAAAASTFGAIASQLVSGDSGNVTLTGSGTVNSANIGSYSTTNGSASVANGLTLNTLALTGTAASNYSITTANYTINPATLTITANPQTKVYGSTDPTLTYSESGLLSGDSDTLSGALTRVAGETVLGGPYAINQGTLASTNSNYTLSYTGNNLTITAKPITIAGSKTYNQSASAPSATFGSITSQLVSGDSGNVTLTGTGTLGSANAASYSTANGNASVINGITLNTLALTGTAASNYSITTANYTINPATLTITANPQTKVYGSTDPTLTYSESGLLSGDSDTLSGALTRTAGETVLGGPYAINQGTLASTNGNYTISYTGNNLTITAKPITIAGSRPYDSTTAAAASTFGALTSQLVSGDSGNVTLTGSGTVNSANVGSYSTTNGNASVANGFSLNTLALTGSAASNYALTTANYSITAAQLAIANGTKIYDGTLSVPAADITSLSGLQSGDSLGGDLTISGTGSITSANVGTYTGTASTFSISGLTLGGSAANNYTLSPGTFTVTAKPVTIAGSKTYNQSASAPSATFGSITSQLVSGDSGNVTLTGTGTLGSANAASYSTANGNASVINGITLNTLALTGSAAGNYAITAATYTINPATLLISANPETKVYGSTDPTLTYTETGLIGSDTDTLSGAQTRVAGETVLGGPYAISQGTLASTNSNYSISYTGNNLTITAKPVTIAGSKTYDQTTAAAASTFGSITAQLVGTDAVSLTGTGTLGSANAGNYSSANSGATGLPLTGLSLTGTAASNYALTAATYTINPATLLVSANPETKVYGSTDPTLTYTETGLIGSDTDTLSGAQTRVAGETVLGGPYAISQGTLASTNSNYSISYTGNNLTITAKPVTITGTKVYDSTTVAAASTFGALTSQLVSGDSGNVTLTGTGTLGSANVGSYSSANSGTTGLPLTSYSLTGSAASNYALTLANYTVTAAPAITITASPQSKTYGTVATLGTTAFTTTGLVGSDTIGGVTLTSTGTPATAPATTYAIVPSNETGGTFNPANYAGVNYVNGVLTVNPATLLVSANPETKVYGTSDPTLTYTDTGIVNGDPNPLTGTLTRNPGETVAGGPYAITQGTLTTTNSNYTISYTGNNLTITAKPVTITGTKVYDSTTVAAASTFGALTSQLVSGDSGNVTLTGTGTLGSANVGSYSSANSGTTGLPLTSYSLTGSAASNYALTLANYTVTAAPAITITASPQSKTYGTVATLGTTAFMTTGLVGSDTIGGVTLTSTGTPATAPVTTYAIVPSNETGGTFNPANYLGVNYVNGVLRVNAAVLTLSGGKVYDGNGTAPSGDITTVSGLQNSDSVGTDLTLTGAGSITSPNVGTYTGTGATFATTGLTLGGSAAANYTIAPGTFSVTAAPLVITANSTSKTYGTPLTFAGTEFTTSGLVGGQTVGSTTLTSTGAPATAPVSGSPYSIAISAATGGTFNPANYSISYVPGTLTIDPATILVSANPQTKVYGSPDPTLTYTDTGLLSGDPNPLTGTLTRTPGETVLGGPYTITQGTLTSTSTNYVISYSSNNLTITAKPITIIGSKVYDKTTTAAVSTFGSINPQLVTGDIGNVTLTGTGTLGSPNVGAYSSANSGTTNLTLTGYSLTGTAASNYALVLANYTVNQAPLTITAVNTTKVYDGGVSSVGIPTYSGLLTGDTISGLSQTYVSRNVLGLNGSTLTPSATSYTITDGNSGGNYSVTLVTSPGTITPEPLTVTAIPTTKPYDGTPTSPGTPIVTTGVVYGPDAGKFIETYGSVNVGAGLTLTPSGYVSDGNGGNNYTITFVPVTTGVIQAQIPNISIPFNQTTAGEGSAPGDFTIYNGGILYIRPNQNGIVTGTIATIDGQNYEPDAQLGCTLGASGACLQNGVNSQGETTTSTGAN